MDEDSRRRQLRIKKGLEKECEPIRIRRLDILKRRKKRKGVRIDAF